MNALSDVSINSLEQGLRALTWPPEVQDLRVEEGEDATGDEAIWVWLLVEPGAASGVSAQDRILDFKHVIQSEVARLVPGLWAYVRLENPPKNAPSKAA